MKWVRIALIMVLQSSCVYSAVLLVKNRRIWMADVRAMHAQGEDYSGMEVPLYPEIGMAANWPMHFAVTTGDPGLPPLVLSLLLIFALSISMHRTIGPRFSVYSAAFLVALLAFNLGMVLQQNSFLQMIYQGKPPAQTSDQPGYTSAHGFVYWVKNKEDPNGPEQPKVIGARDPNVIPVLLITCFLASWLPFSGQALLKGHRKATGRSA